jgi:biotin-(acetyl-CoA carboxylase) ligase
MSVNGWPRSNCGSPTGGHCKREWISIETAKTDEWAREHLLRRLTGELASWLKRLEKLGIEDPIFAPAIDGIRETKRLLEARLAATETSEHEEKELIPA